MAIKEVIIQAIAEEILLPDFPSKFYPEKVGKQALPVYMKIERRLWNKYRVPPGYAPRLEDLPFYLYFPIEDGKDKDAAVVERFLEIYRHDRDAVRRAAEMVESGVSLFSTFWGLYGSPFRKALTEISREKTPGDLIIAVDEVPDLTLEEGIDLLSRKIASCSRYPLKPSYEIEPTPEDGEEVSVETRAESMVEETLEREEAASIDEEKQELRKEVEALKEEVADV